MIQCILDANPNSDVMYMIDTRPKVRTMRTSLHVQCVGRWVGGEGVCVMYMCMYAVPTLLGWLNCLSTYVPCSSRACFY